MRLGGRGEGGTRHFFLLTLYNLKNVGGTCPPGSPAPRSLNFQTNTQLYLFKIINLTSNNHIYLVPKQKLGVLSAFSTLISSNSSSLYGSFKWFQITFVLRINKLQVIVNYFCCCCYTSFSTRFKHSNQLSKRKKQRLNKIDLVLPCGGRHLELSHNQCITLSINQRNVTFLF